MNSWKVPYIAKGICTFIPGAHALGGHRGGTVYPLAPRYCYTVWLRHYVKLSALGVPLDDVALAELGPGDTFGVGLAALLTGASSYSGLDVIPYAAHQTPVPMLRSLERLFTTKEAIPDGTEYPHVRPILGNYEYPAHLIAQHAIQRNADRVARDLLAGMSATSLVRYVAPWADQRELDAESVDLILSQAVMEHVEDLEFGYQASFAWLRPGGYASHVIDFGSHHLAPTWNGHWQYRDWEWQMVRGTRKWTINRWSLQAHLDLAQKAGFEVVLAERYYDANPHGPDLLAPRFRSVASEDLRTRAALLVLRKP